MSEKAANFRVLEGGPLEVSGDFTLTGKHGDIIEAGSPVYLCRCGSSKNKPFCDGSHKKIGFNK